MITALERLRAGCSHGSWVLEEASVGEGVCLSQTVGVKEGFLEEVGHPSRVLR